MKKVTTIFFLVISFVGVIGYQFILETIRENHKESVMERISGAIPESALTAVNAASDDIVWLENGKEFYYKMEMYDVVKQVDQNGNKILLCISDKQEKQILEKQKSLLEEGTTGSSKGPKQQKAIETIDLFSYNTDLAFSNQDFLDKRITPFIKNTALLSSILDINTPPPRL